MKVQSFKEAYKLSEALISFLESNKEQIAKVGGYDAMRRVLSGQEWVSYVLSNIPDNVPDEKLPKRDLTDERLINALAKAYETTPKEVRELLGESIEQ